MGPELTLVGSWGLLSHISLPQGLAAALQVLQGTLQSVSAALLTWPFPALHSCMLLSPELQNQNCK